MADLSELPSGAEKARMVQGMFDAIAPRYDLVNRIMTFGLDMGWRRDTVRNLRLPPRSLVLDVACGTGDFCRVLQRVGMHPIGFDLSAGMLSSAHTSAALVRADALRLPVRDNTADGITCGFALRNVADLGGLFEEFSRILKPGGRLGILEVTEPRSRIPRKLHSIYFHHVVPMIGGLLSDGDAYRYLPRSVAYLPDTSALLHLIARHGFVDVMRCTRGFSAAQIITATK